MRQKKIGLKFKFFYKKIKKEVDVFLKLWYYFICPQEILKKRFWR
jgi:hypothetical protein